MKIIYVFLLSLALITSNLIGNTETYVHEDIIGQDQRAERIDLYYAERDMPLAGYGEAIVRAADENGLDYRLVAAIGVIESSGGKHACGGNAWGWGSCKIRFDTFSEGIETVSRNLGGNNPNTATYYKGKTLDEILYAYNGSVEAGYGAKVKAVMEKL